MAELDLQQLQLHDMCVYIHVPFCDTICDFCAFTKVKTDQELIERYLKALCEEFELFSTKYSIDLRASTRTLYFGGGTPSVLSQSQLENILSNFNVLSIEEITIECHPNHINPSYLKDLVELGFNRISVGIENTNPNVLQYIGRTPHKATLTQISKMFSQLDFKNWSLDLMFGYSPLTIRQFKKMLLEAMQLDYPPNHISLYALNLEFGTPLAKRKDFLLHDDLIEYYELIESTLQEYGFRWEEISNWHKAGFGSCHNSNYWAQGNFYGFGPGAYSAHGDRRWFNTKVLKGYFENSGSGNLPIAHIEKLSDKDLEFERLILNLRTPKGVQTKHLSDEYINEGLIYHNKKTDRYILTPKGKALSTYLCESLTL